MKACSTRSVSIRKRCRRITLTLFFATCLGYASAQDGQWKFSSGFDFSSGTYNQTSKTKMLFLPFSAQYERDNWSGKISTGWLNIDGPGKVIESGVVLSGGSGSTRSKSGFADTWLALSCHPETFPPEVGFIDFTAKLKIPTADEDKGLGTGKLDCAIQLEHLYTAGKLTPMTTVGYKFRQSPSGYKLNHVLYLSAGADWRCSKKTHIGASLDFQQASTSGTDDLLELLTYMNHKINSEWSLVPYLYYGLSDSSPDAGGGLQFVYKPQQGDNHES